MYSISIPIMIWVLSSAAEPLEISKNLAFSFSVDRSMPSAMFDGIERLKVQVDSINLTSDFTDVRGFWREQSQAISPLAG